MGEEQDRASPRWLWAFVIRRLSAEPQTQCRRTRRGTGQHPDTGSRRSILNPGTGVGQLVDWGRGRDRRWRYLGRARFGGDRGRRSAGNTDVALAGQPVPTSRIRFGIGRAAIILAAASVAADTGRALAINRANKIGRIAIPVNADLVKRAFIKELGTARVGHTDATPTLPTTTLLAIGARHPKRTALDADHALLGLGTRARAAIAHCVAPLAFGDAPDANAIPARSTATIIREPARFAIRLAGCTRPLRADAKAAIAIGGAGVRVFALRGRPAPSSDSTGDGGQSAQQGAAGGSVRKCSRDLVESLRVHGAPRCAAGRDHLRAQA